MGVNVGGYFSLKPEKHSEECQGTLANRKTRKRGNVRGHFSLSENTKAEISGDTLAKELNKEYPRMVEEQFSHKRLNGDEI